MGRLKLSLRRVERSETNRPSESLQQCGPSLNPTEAKAGHCIDEKTGKGSCSCTTSNGKEDAWLSLLDHVSNEKLRRRSRVKKHHMLIEKTKLR